jgi:integrase/recombinase XerD
VSPNLWKRTKQQRLFAELQGFWREDIWDMRNSPVKAGLTPVARQRYLYFECKSQTINNEVKYACWKKFSEGGWRTTATSTLVHRLIKWLNTLNPPPSSFMSQSFENWRAGYTSYLKSCGMYNRGTTKRVDAQQCQRVSPRDSAYIGTLRQVFSILEKAYDDRPEQEKDVWDLRRMAIPVSLSLSDATLNFSSIRQLWLRKAAKAYLQYCLSIYADGTCRTRLQSITCFSEFLSQERPRATAEAITRKLLLRYLSYLPNRLNVATRKGSVINLRTFLEIAARERWLPLGSERMIYDEEVPQPPKPQPRYIPSAVLDQLNKHLGNMKAPWMQMVLVLQECGMRLSELLGLPLDCLTQDARGTFFLQFMQGKMKREHTIPVSQEIARVIQEQQQIVRRSRPSSTILFPNPRGKVFKQSTFTHRINHLAYKHEIRDANGKLFRFQSHQFRHTVGTRMINLGVPHHFIQRYLGHLGPEMTSRYAHIHDATMKEKLSEYLQGTLVDVTGKTLPESGPRDTGDLQWFTRNVLAQALTNGYCAIPIIAGPCPHPNACLNCAHFRTDISFLETHKSELRETDRVIAKATANGWARQIEMNERKRNSLVNIITSLERAHA